MKLKDLRGGVFLVIVGFMLEGIIEIEDIEYIDRGYFEIEKNILNFGEDIKRVN